MQEMSSDLYNYVCTRKVDLKVGILTIFHI
jgi:hypothetical protein